MGAVEVDVKKIATAMLDNGMGWSTLAEAAGLSTCALSNVKHGRKVMPSTAKKIADVFGWKASQIARLSL